MNSYLEACLDATICKADCSFVLCFVLYITLVPQFELLGLILKTSSFSIS